MSESLWQCSAPGAIIPALQRVRSPSDTASKRASRPDVIFARLMVISSRAANARLALDVSRLLGNFASVFSGDLMAYTRWSELIDGEVYMYPARGPSDADE